MSFFHDVSLAHAQSYADLIISLEKENQFDLKEVEQQVINITQIPIGLADYQFKSPAKPVQQSMVVSGFVADANNYLSYK